MAMFNHSRRKAVIPWALAVLLVKLAIVNATDSTCIYAPFERQNLETNTCECLPGLSGWGCRMCDSNAACEQVDGNDNRTTWECLQGLEYRADLLEKAYTCTLDESLAQAFPNQGLDIRCDPTLGSCRMAVYNRDTRVQPTNNNLDCLSEGCTFVDGESSFECANTNCQCGSGCDFLTRMAVNSMSGSSARIIVEGNHVSVDITGSFVALGATCFASSCVQTGFADPFDGGSTTGDAQANSGNSENPTTGGQTTLTGEQSTTGVRPAGGQSTTGQTTGRQNTGGQTTGQQNTRGQSTGGGFSGGGLVGGGAAGGVLGFPSSSDDDDEGASPAAKAAAAIFLLSLLSIVGLLGCLGWYRYHLSGSRNDDNLTTALSTTPNPDKDLMVNNNGSGPVFAFDAITSVLKEPPVSPLARLLGKKQPKKNDERKILDGLAGRVNGGEVMAILGPSGAGKTTLLNVLAGVNAGSTSTTGSITINGEPRNSRFRKISAYVHQSDTLFGTLTVRECLEYSALLRLPSSMPLSTKQSIIDELLQELQLSRVAENRVGSPEAGIPGISGGERRRVSIGMELVTSPQILFLDEPTSGLDSATANAIVSLVHDVARRHNRIAIMSIHQPSSKAFVLFDTVLILAKGGRSIFYGKGSRASAVFGKAGYPCPANENVADHMLDVVSDPDAVASLINNPKMPRFPKDSMSRKMSSRTIPEEQAYPYVDEGIGNGTPYSSQTIPLSDDSSFEDSSNATSNTDIKSQDQTVRRKNSKRRGKFSSPIFAPTQTRTEILMSVPPESGEHKGNSFMGLLILLDRTAKDIYRNRALLFAHLLVSLTLGIAGGIIFKGVSNDLAGFQNRSGAFYFVLTFFAFASLSSIDLFLRERAIFIREAGAGYYSALTYFSAKSFLDALLLRIVPAFLFAIIFYWIMGLQNGGGRFMVFLVTLLLFNVAAGAITVCISVSASSVGVANLVATVVYLIQLLFGGFLVNFDSLSNLISWLQTFSIFNYGFEILMTNELEGLLLSFNAPGYPAIPVKGEVFLLTLGMDVDKQVGNIIALLAIAFFCNLASFIILSLRVPVPKELEQSDKQIASPPPPSPSGNFDPV